jgi:hypothetical protein
VNEHNLPKIQGDFTVDRTNSNRSFALMKPIQRCPWARTPLDIKHHDEESGAPCSDDGAMFEMLILEAAQAGHSWSTILAKRENYRRAFACFDACAFGGVAAKDVRRLLADPGIVATVRRSRQLSRMPELFLPYSGSSGRSTAISGLSSTANPS